MAKNSHEFDDAKVRELIAANQEAIETLHAEVERLTMFLELRALKARAQSSPASESIRGELRVNVHRTETILKKAARIRELLQGALDEIESKTRREPPNKD